MKRAIEIVLALGAILACMLFLASCNHDAHWAITRKTPSGKHEYMVRAWSKESCNKLTPTAPVKPKTYKRLKNTFVIPGRK